jgi:DNA-binding CsgD family transcriptional regulator
MPQDLLVQLSGASLARTDDDFAEALLRAWSQVVKAGYHSLIRHAPNGGRVKFWCPGEGRLGPDHWLPRLFAKLLVLEASSESHPNTAAFLREGPGVYLRSALVDDRAWKRSEHYRLVDKPQGIRDMVCIFMKPMPDLLVTMHAGSHEGNFPRSTLAAARTFAPVAEALIRARGGFTDRTAAPAVELSPREREILHWVGEGKRNAEIATILQLSPLTVRKHLENIFSKLGVETRTAAAAALRDTPAN